MCLSIKRIGIVGAGISGLTMAYNINQIAASRHQSIFVDILQAEQRPGGRIKSASSVNQKMKKDFQFDLGANLIDFQNAQSRKVWQSLIPADMTQKLILFKKPFLIYDYDSKAFRKGDYQKQRFFYKDGFQNFINNIISHLNEKQTNISYNCKVVGLGEINGKVKLIFQNKLSTQQQERIYDNVFLSCPPPQILEIITHNNKYSKKDEGIISEQIQEIMKFCNAANYTKQLSVGFFANKIIEDFSCVLFKSHPIITFICSNREKYNDSSFVVQTTQKFTDNYSKKNIDQYKQQILNNVYDSLPQSVKQLTIQQKGIVHFWGVSLYKGSQKEGLMEKNRLIHVIGDSRMGKSRVSGAIQSLMQHLIKL